jgi:hypothetical protein
MHIMGLGQGMVQRHYAEQVMRRRQAARFTIEVNLPETAWSAGLDQNQALLRTIGVNLFA